MELQNRDLPGTLMDLVIDSLTQPLDVIVQFLEIIFTLVGVNLVQDFHRCLDLPFRLWPPGDARFHLETEILCELLEPTVHDALTISRSRFGHDGAHVVRHELIRNSVQFFEGLCQE